MSHRVEDDDDERVQPPRSNDDDDDDDPRTEEGRTASVPVEAPLPRGSHRTATTTAREEAVLGATAHEDGVAGFEEQDPTGHLVQERFGHFLHTCRERIETSAGGGTPRWIYPYAEQAREMARVQRARRSLPNEDPDDDDQEEDDDTRDPQQQQAQEADRPSGSKSGGGLASTLLLDMMHLMQHDMELAEALQTDWIRFEPFIQRAIQTFVHDLYPDLAETTATHSASTLYFCAVHQVPTVVPLRDLRTDRVGRLTALLGTVTRTTEVRPELLWASFRCRDCGLLAPPLPQQYHYTRPVLCRNPRCKNTSPAHFVLESASSHFVDWQKMRVQEPSDEIPPGSMPRSLDVVVRHEMVERCSAGDTCLLVGCWVVIPDGSALARAGETPRAVQGRLHSADAAAGGGGGGVRGLKALGVRELTYRTCFVANCVIPNHARLRLMATPHQASTAAMATLLFGSGTHTSSWSSPADGSTPRPADSHEPTAEEVVMEMTRAQRMEIRDMKCSPRLYEQLVESIAPTVFGHKEVKKGLLLMLLGGVHKTTPDGIQLRGDINVCIVGDPSTAKSQFLKYVTAFWPSRAVYTSGKASTAAGLTAAVQRDADTGEFCIEAGALMLADQGICCIDEFDKMDPTDQVAIHEAMEQQTISITKAGIQATLNARASILAAANPVHGRYDRTKTLKANVALSAPILSRFDLFFVVLDECHPEADRHVAQHILKVHRCEEEAVRPPFTKEQMQRYIRFARTIHPHITVQSQRVLVDCYRKLRQGDTLGRSRSAYRITVRQLESMIRLSEALAKLHCDPEIQPAYVREAFRLLKTSIIQVETSDIDIDDNDDDELGDDGLDAGADGHPSGENEPGESADPMEDEPDTQVRHPGEYGADELASGPRASGSVADRNLGPTEGAEKKKKQKTKISFEEYEAMANAIASHLRSWEVDRTGDAAEPTGPDGSADHDTTAAGESRYLKWSQVVEWYLEQMEHEIGDSLERLEEMRKKVNLVIRRLVQVDMILITVGAPPRNKAQEPHTLLAVHPNYPLS